MKKLIILFFILIFSSFLVSAATSPTCPVSGYAYCTASSEFNSGSLSAGAEVFWGFEDNRGILIPNNLAVKNLYYNVGYKAWGSCGYSTCSGCNKLYMGLNSPSWASCDSTGCSGTGYSQISQGKVLLATTGQTYNNCLNFQHWYRKSSSSSSCTSGSTYAWAGIGSGWIGSSNCVSIRVVDCVSSSDCTGGLVCNNNACVSACTPATCSSLGKTCGSWSDGCQGNLNCGPLTSGNNVCNSSGQYQQVATAYYQVNVLNNGNVPYTNIKLTSTNPSALFSYFPTNIFSLNSGQNANWTSTSIDISSYHGQTLTAYVQANNTYTSQINNFQASILIP